MKDLPPALKPITVWLLLATALFLAVQAGLDWQRRSRFSMSGPAIELKRGPDGHFHWPGRVNGVAVEFLVDTGATRSALPRAVAERAGLTLESPVQSSTAGGVARGWIARADLELEGGASALRQPVIVLPDLASPLLGMDLLSKTRFTQQGGVLRLEPPG